jgi:hypothetical protein
MAGLIVPGGYLAGRVSLIGFDEAEGAALAARLGTECVRSEMLPRIRVMAGRLSVEDEIGGRYVAVSRVVFHGIFEDDLDFLAGLCLWGGPCFPNPAAMMDCRLRLPCLVRALRHTRFGGPPRGFLSAGAACEAKAESVAKWGNWHCGENKERFIGHREAPEATLVEPFLAGNAVRVVLLGERVWQIRMAGKGWLKSVHGEGASFMDTDPLLVDDTRAVRRGLGLDIIANDYIVGTDGPYLLEVNHPERDVPAGAVGGVCRSGGGVGGELIGAGGEKDAGGVVPGDGYREGRAHA